jgi:hypothetical protein
MTDPIASKVIPRTIHLRWLENDDFLYEYSLLESWSPFEAACLINGMQPGAIVSGAARIGRVPDPELGEDYNQDPQEYLDQNRLKTLTDIILRNFDKQLQVSATHIVRWAVDKGELSSNSYLAKRYLTTAAEMPLESSLGASLIDQLESKLAEANKRADNAEKLRDSLKAELDRSHKKTGMEHAKRRMIILGAALNELVLLCPPSKFIKNQQLIASRLAEELNESRDIYNMPVEYGFGLQNIIDTLREAKSLALKTGGEEFHSEVAPLDLTEFPSL